MKTEIRKNIRSKIFVEKGRPCIEVFCSQGTYFQWLNACDKYLVIPEHKAYVWESTGEGYKKIKQTPRDVYLLNINDYGHNIQCIFNDVFLHQDYDEEFTDLVPKHLKNVFDTYTVAIKKGKKIPLPPSIHGWRT